MPVTLVILVVAFGALVAAGIPVLLAFSAVRATLGLAALVSHVLPASDATASIILLIGMAVGVDYSLFYLRREREEAAAGRDARAALQVAAATSGKAVLVSGGRQRAGGPTHAGSRQSRPHRRRDRRPAAGQ